MIFYFAEAKEAEDVYTQIFGCGIGYLSVRYLYIPVHYRRLLNNEWSVIEEKVEKKLSSWKGRNLSMGGRLVLLNSVLSSFPIFMISFFEVSKEVIKKLDYFCSRFYWQNDQHK